MDKERIKEKIKKLMTLAEDGSNDSESYSALEKAQKLMAEYKIEADEIKDPDEKKECVVLKTRFSFSTRSSDTYLSHLADIIADNFCCVTFFRRIGHQQKRSVCFMGYEEDVLIAEKVMSVANACIYKGYNRVYKDMCKKYDVSSIPARYFNPAKEGYIKGYLKGLKEVFDRQKEKNQEWGLVLVAPQEATDYIGGLTAVDISARRVISTTYNEIGYNDGKSFVVNEQIDHKEE